MNDLVGTGPELIGGEAGTGNGFVIHEVEQDFGDLKATDLNVFSHCLPHSAQLLAFESIRRYVVLAAAYYMMNYGCENRAKYVTERPISSSWSLGGQDVLKKVRDCSR